MACAPKAGQEKPPPDGPFAVSDYYAPSGAMGDGATNGNLIAHTDTPCKARPPGARGSCYSFEYVASAPYTTPVNHTTGVCNWAGVFFQHPANNWGAEQGEPVPSGQLTKLTFQVAVAAGSELLSFQAGGIGVPPLPDGAPAPPPATACPPAETPPPIYYDDISSTVMLPVGTDWQKIEIPIMARQPGAPVPATTNLIGAFSWGISASGGLPKTVYIDDLFYE